MTKHKVKHLLAVLLSTVMVLSMTACGKSDDVQQSENSASTEKESNIEKGKASEEKEKVSLRLVRYGEATARAQEFYENELHDKVLEDLNIDLSIEFLPWGSHDTTLQTMLASGEEFAVMNILGATVADSKGYFATIDEEKIQELMPDYLKSRGNNGFDVARFNGDIIVIPFGNKPYAGRSQTFRVRNDILNEVGYDATEITIYEQLMEAVEAVHGKYPDMRIIAQGGTTLYWSMKAVLTDEWVVGIENINDNFVYANQYEENDKIYSIFESELFKNLCLTAEEWYNKGYILDDELSDSAKCLSDWDTGNCLLRSGSPNDLVDPETVENNVPSAEIDLIKIGDLPLTISRDYDWGISISANDAKNTDRWLELFNWMFKDPETYNLLLYGVEGQDWQRDADGNIERLVTDEFFPSWFMETLEYHEYSSSIPEEKLARYKGNDEGAVIEKTAGFSFDVSPVASEQAMIAAVWDEYVLPMIHGYLSYEENYESVLQKLKDAGLDTYVAEYQKQFTEFYNAR